MTNRPLNAIANGQIRVLVNHELGANGKGPGKYESNNTICSCHIKTTHLFFFFLAEHEIMSKMETSFEKVAKLESDVMSECKYTL